MSLLLFIILHNESYNLSNTYWSLNPQIGLSIPFSFLAASFKAIPNSLSEAAMIEGADA